MNTAGMCGKSIKHLTSRHFLPFICKESTTIAVSWGTYHYCCVLRNIKSEAKRYFFCTNIDGANKRSMQRETVTRFLCFQANRQLHFSSPLRHHSRKMSTMSSPLNPNWRPVGRFQKLEGGGGGGEGERERGREGEGEREGVGREGREREREGEGEREKERGRKREGK